MTEQETVVGYLLALPGYEYRPGFYATADGVAGYHGETGWTKAQRFATLRDVWMTRRDLTGRDNPRTGNDWGIYEILTHQRGNERRARHPMSEDEIARRMARGGRP